LHDNPTRALSTTLPPPTPATGQENILVAIVNQADTTSARLEGLWFIMIEPEFQAYALVPLYPSLSKSDTTDNPISIDPKDQKSISDLRCVQNEKIIWHHIIVVDEFAINLLLDLMGGVKVGKKINSISDLPGFNSPIEDPGKTIESQQKLFRGLCRRLPTYKAQSDFFTLTYPTHLISDMNSAELRELFEKVVAAGPKVKCEIILP
jgi:hypothetical protein